VINSILCEADRMKWIVVMGGRLSVSSTEDEMMLIWQPGRNEVMPEQPWVRE
jgi:hypothetical protein